MTRKNIVITILVAILSIGIGIAIGIGISKQRIITATVTNPQSVALNQSKVQLSHLLNPSLSTASSLDKSTLSIAVLHKALGSKAESNVVSKALSLVEPSQQVTHEEALNLGSSSLSSVELKEQLELVDLSSPLKAAKVVDLTGQLKPVDLLSQLDLTKHVNLNEHLEPAGLLTQLGMAKLVDLKAELNQAKTLNLRSQLKLMQHELFA
jgi:hypothetical protein